MDGTGAQRIRWKASSALLRVVGERPYESLQVRWVARSIRSGRWRDVEVDLLPQLVAPGETAIDVGANFGLYSFHLARLVGDAGRVIAVEAIPSTARLLRQTLALLGVAGRVELHECGAGDHDGVATFVLPRRPDGSVDTGVAWARPPSGAAVGEDEVTVRVSRLDELVSDGAAFVKVDTEGAELPVLRGAEGLIARYSPTLLLEVSPSTFARQGIERSDLAALLDAWGYTAYRFDPLARRLVPQPVSEANGNVLAVHPRYEERIRALLP